jgi:cytochrome P450
LEQSLTIDVDYVFEVMHKQLDKPPLMLVDMRPLNVPVILLTTHQLAEQVARPSKMMPMSAPKAGGDHMTPLMGATSLIHACGDQAKTLRKRYSPAFAPSNIMRLLPTMIKAMDVFVEHIEDFANTGETFEFGDMVKLLTFDIIGSATLGVDLKGLPRKGEKQGEIVRSYLELFNMYLDDKNDFPWWLAPRLFLRRKRAGKYVENLLKDVIREQRQAKPSAAPKSSRTILELSVPPEEELTDELLDETSDQIKSFLLAGHDTAATTLAWVFYYLHRTPRALEEVRKELDKLLGPVTEPSAIMQKLSSDAGPEIIHNMTYISAVIKEAMRLQPAAASARRMEPGTGFKVHDEAGNEYSLDGTLIYLIPYLIHRDRAAFGETAEDFIPERWLESDINIPATAFRGFERGARACIGQDFALVEMRLVIATLIRKYDFVKVGLGELDLDAEKAPVLDEHGVARVKTDMYSVSTSTISVPK